VVVGGPYYGVVIKWSGVLLYNALIIINTSMAQPITNVTM